MVQPLIRVLGPILGLTLIILIGGSTLLIGLEARWPGLYVDMWDEWPALTGTIPLTDYLFQAYAGAHRLVLPRLVFLVEHHVFRHGNGFTFSVSLAFHALAFGILSETVRRDKTVRRPLRHGLWFIAALVVVSGLHLYNLLYPFLVQWFQVVALAFAGLALLVYSRPTLPSGFHSGLALTGLGLCVLASFCNFPGVVALVAYAWVAVSLRCPGAWRWWLPGLSLLFAGLHAASLLQPLLGHGGSVSLSLPTLLAAWTVYLLRFLGTPLTLWHEGLGMLWGAMLLGYTTWHASRWLLTGRTLSPATGSALAGLTFLVGVAAATTLGRSMIPDTAVAPRFHTIHLWLQVCFLWHVWLFSAMRPDRARWLAAGLTVIALTAIVALQPRALNHAFTLATKIERAHIAYALGVGDWHTHALLSVPHKGIGLNPALDYREALRRTGQGIFARPPYAWLRTETVAPVTSVETLSRCPALVSVRPVTTEHSKLEGLLPQDVSVDTLIMVDSNRVIRGLGLPRPPARWTALWQPPERWVGFAPRHHGNLAILARRTDGGWCHLGYTKG